jgi:CheY-like chemotaxis protein
MVRLRNKIGAEAKLWCGGDTISTILVVEDEANVRKLVAINLTSRGYKVIEAANGEEALARLHDQTPSMMVLDIKLPDITGWEILNILDNDPSLPADFPVLVMTASLGDAHIDLKPYPHVIEVLIKPFKTERLISTIQRTLRPNDSASVNLI